MQRKNSNHVPLIFIDVPPSPAAPNDYMIIRGLIVFNIRRVGYLLKELEEAAFEIRLNSMESEHLIK